MQGSACFETCCHGDGTHTRAHKRLPLHQPPVVAILADRNTFFHAGHVDLSAAVGTCALKCEPGMFVGGGKTALHEVHVALPQHGVFMGVTEQMRSRSDGGAGFKVASGNNLQ